MLTNRTFLVGDKVYQRSGRPYIMGILNVTPDSFSDGGRRMDPVQAIDWAWQMAEAGADFIDIGGESSRPGSLPVPVEEELKRVLPVIQALALKLTIPLSVDTTKAQVAHQALDAGAQIINDISALRSDPDLATVISRAQATLVLMHMQGEPRTMQVQPYYDNVIDEIHDFLAARIQVALEAGIAGERIIVDPGLGFGKRFGDNFEIIGRLREFTDLGPILVGPSRKNFIGQALEVPVEERLFGTAAAVAIAAVHGADIIRVHDVKPMREVAEIAYQCLTRTETKTSANY